MFASTITINDSAAAAKSFVQVNTQDGTRRLDNGTSLSAPRAMLIKHTSSGAGSKVVDRHLLSFTHTLVDSAGIPYTATANLTIAVPRNSTVTATNVKDLWYFIKNFLTDANLTSVLLGEG